MTEKFFEELGYFSEQTCKGLQKVLDGKSFYDLKVKYSNYASNCTLIVRSDHPDATSDEVGKMMVRLALDELSELARKKFMLETYITKSVGYERKLLFFMQHYEYTAWFADARCVSSLLGLRLCCSEPDKYDFVYIDRERFQKYADYLRERGYVVEVVDITDFGR